MNLLVVPAYGRTYASAEIAAQDWAKNLDFRISGFGPYINKADAEKYEYISSISIFCWKTKKQVVLFSRNK